ncbi:hypothetical protein MNBD_GAMMA22-2849, partial [hydrothermal vent metagenome]
NTKKIRPDLIKNNLLKICLVSNRQLGSDLKRSFEDDSSDKYTKLRDASGLKEQDTALQRKLY